MRYLITVLILVALSGCAHIDEALRNASEPSNVRVIHGHRYTMFCREPDNRQETYSEAIVRDEINARVNSGTRRAGLTEDCTVIYHKVRYKH